MHPQGDRSADHSGCRRRINTVVATGLYEYDGDEDDDGYGSDEDVDVDDPTRYDHLLNELL